MVEELDRLHWENYDLDLEMIVLSKAISNINGQNEGTCVKIPNQSHSIGTKVTRTWKFSYRI